MRKLMMAGVLTLAAALAPVAGAQQGGMMGGGCPMMGMMGPGMGQGGMGQGGMGQGGMGQGGMGQGQMHPGMMSGPEQMGALVEGRLAYLHSALGITAAQEPTWLAYAEAVRTQAATMQQTHATLHETMMSGAAPDRMAARIAGMSAMLAALQTLQPATAALYAGLADDQKSLADQLIGMDCGAF